MSRMVALIDNKTLTRTIILSHIPWHCTVSSSLSLLTCKCCDGQCPLSFIPLELFHFCTKHVPDYDKRAWNFTASALSLKVGLSLTFLIVVPSLRPLPFVGDPKRKVWFMLGHSWLSYQSYCSNKFLSARFQTGVWKIIWKMI